MLPSGSSSTNPVRAVRAASIRLPSPESPAIESLASKTSAKWFMLTLRSPTGPVASSVGSAPRSPVPGSKRTTVFTSSA